MRFLVYLLLLIESLGFAQNARPSFPSTEDATGEGVPLTSVIKGSSSTGVNSQMCLMGETSGGLLNTILIDASRQTVIAPLTSASTPTCSQGGSWTTGRTWTLSSGTDSCAAVQSGAWTVTGNQGTPNTAANGWPVKVTDGTNTQAVKAASTAATATDPSAVVAISPNSPLPAGTNNIGETTPTGIYMSGYAPDPSSYDTGEVSGFTFDNSSQLMVRATVISDEGSFRDDFSGSALTTTITGTLQFTNGSPIVTCTTSCAFTSELTTQYFVKKTADASTLYLQVASVESDTQFTLDGNYAGTTAATSGVFSRWRDTIGTGGAVAVSTSNLNISTGTSNNSVTYVQTYGDYLPYTGNWFVSLSGRTTQQRFGWGFMDAWPTPTKGAWVECTGSVNTTCNFISRFSSAAADTQTTAFTFPNAGTSATTHEYKIDLSANAASLSVDGILVAQNRTHLPGPYDILNITMGSQNTGGGGSNLTAAYDYVYYSNFDRIQVDNDFIGEPISTTLRSSTGGNVSTANSAVGSTIAIESTAIPVDGMKLSYSFNATNFTVAAVAPTDIFVIGGSASKTVRVTRLEISCTETTAAVRDILLIKRSTANTGGTSSALTMVPHDSTNAAATATALSYTANPTLGTAVGTVRSIKALIPTVTTTTQPIVWDFGTRPSQAVVLRGTAQQLAVNLNGVASAGGTCDISGELTEE